jgi:hypothetical protein
VELFFYKNPLFLDTIASQVTSKREKRKGVGTMKSNDQTVFGVDPVRVAYRAKMQLFEEWSRHLTTAMIERRNNIFTSWSFKTIQPTAVEMLDESLGMLKVYLHHDPTPLLFFRSHSKDWPLYLSLLQTACKNGEPVDVAIVVERFIAKVAK